MSAHFLDQCRHGTVIKQCRCPGPKRITTMVLCPDSCAFKSAPSGPKYPPPGVITNAGR